MTQTTLCLIIVGMAIAFLSTVVYLIINIVNDSSKDAQPNKTKRICINILKFGIWLGLATMLIGGALALSETFPILKYL